MSVASGGSILPRKDLGVGRLEFGVSLGLVESGVIFGPVATRREGNLAHVGGRVIIAAGFRKTSGSDGKWQPGDCAFAAVTQSHWAGRDLDKLGIGQGEA